MHRVEMQWGVQIPLRDGVRLSATLYLPAQVPAAPAICTLTPYTAQSYHEQGMYFASHGYPFLSVDVRGRGNSEGIFKPNINEARDGADVVAWLAAQPFCNGQVTMWGGSYAGYSQWAVAREFPEPLATIVPVASPYFAVDFPIRKNIASLWVLQWLMLVAGRALQDKIVWNNEKFWGDQFRQWFEAGLPYKDLGSQLGVLTPIFQEWAEHPHQGEYWDQYNPTDEQYAHISIPVLTITGIYDDDQLGALEHYRLHLKNRSTAGASHFLVIGPWDHAGTRVPRTEFCGLKAGDASLLDLPKLHLDWYNWTMRGGPQPEFLKKRVAYYVMAADKWRYADTLDEITQSVEPFYLDSENNPTDLFRSGLLKPTLPARSGVDSYVYDPSDRALAVLESTIDPENRADQRMVLAAVGRRLIYHSAPFAQDTEISGFFKLTVWIEIDQPDTDFAVSVADVGLDGSAIQLTSDWMRARYRDSLRHASAVQIGVPLSYEFSGFTFTSRLIRRGHRLRLVIGPIDSIFVERNYNAGGVVAEESGRDARTVTVTLHHDEAHPSVLWVPIAHPER